MTNHDDKCGRCGHRRVDHIDTPRPRCRHESYNPSTHDGMPCGCAGFQQLLPVGAVQSPLSTPDAVNHPPHYKRGGIECIDVIEAWSLGFNLGNAVKYVSRAGHKDGARDVEDLKKARWYLDREIARRETTK